jgi:hypothetical protein
VSKTAEGKKQMRGPDSMPVAQQELVTTLLNATIHELVFVAHHIGDDQYEEAAQALMTAQSNLDSVAELVAIYDPSNA